jgi:CMP-N-acetylneuraminic acid synthetase
MVFKINRKKIFLIIKNQSERVRRKNFRILAGQTLHEYFVSRRSGWDIFIDTDSKDILDFYSNNEVWPHVHAYPRLDEHVRLEATGNISPAPLMVERFLRDHVVSDLEPVTTSHITSPFIQDQTILDALAETERFDSVSSVAGVKEFVVERVGANSNPINFSPKEIVKTQSLEPVGVLNGAFFIIKKNIYLRNGLRRISDNHLYYPISQVEALDIDTEFDLRLAQIIAKELL